jgi:two-component system sensor histidine kinase DesK
MMAGVPYTGQASHLDWGHPLRIARTVMASDRTAVAGAAVSAPGRFAVARLLRQLPANRMAPYIAWAILFVVMCGFDTVTFISIQQYPAVSANIQIGVLYLVAILVLQIFYFSNPFVRPRPPVGYLLLGVQAGLAFLPVLQFRQMWSGQACFLAGTVLLILPRRVAWSVFPLIAAGNAALRWHFDHVGVLISNSALNAANTGVAVIDTGLVVFGLTRLAGLVTRLHEARTELAEMAVAQERLRFARDLHDLLGYSLSAITLKSELTHRLALKNPEKAREELTEVLDISRRALADVRSVARGYRELSLDAEAASATSVLTAADVDVRMDLRYGKLPSPVRTLLATVLREGVTNVLRHSKAEHCDIAIREEHGRVEMDIRNDGVPQAPVEQDPNSGSGIGNLSSRVTALGGHLSTGIEPDGRFRLHLTVPVPAPRRGPRITAGAAR